MQKVKGFLGFLYTHPFIRYLFVGGTTFLIDVGVLIFCHEVLNIRIAIAASISYWISVLYNFCLNRWWTFSVSEEEAIHKHALLYGFLLAGNYVFTVVFISTVSHFVFYGWAKVLSTGIQVLWTYPIYKYLIFKRSAA